MKTIIAYIQPHREESVREALHLHPELGGASFINIRGFGRGRGRTKEAQDEAMLGTLPKVRVEIMVNDDIAEQVVNAIAKAAHTGRQGDGKVYVLPLESALRISTGERGGTAV